MRAWLGLLGLVLAAGSAPGRAQLVNLPPTWEGELASRPRLTGNWGGSRDQLGQHGVVFDVDLLVTPMAVVSGGRSTGSNTWGNVDYTLNVDTDKAGLWPGGYLEIAADTGLGGNVFTDSGAVVPVNTAALLPAQGVHTTALLNATLLQFLSPKFGVVVGKINTLESDKLEFYGDYSTQFLNAAFVSPMTAQQVPLSAFGGGLIGLPTGDIVLSAVVLDPNGSPTSSSLDNAFNNGAMVLGSADVTVRPSGLLGHQELSLSWSNKDRLSLEQDRANLARYLLQTELSRLGTAGSVLEQLLAHFFPGLAPVAPPRREGSSWSASYGFDQYLWQPPGDAQHGIGVFFSAGATDGNPNPIKYAFLLGVGGKGVPGRPDDSYGLGIARTQFSSAFVPLLRETLDLGLEREDALEMYYNVAITGWLSATADLQVVNPGLKKSLNLATQSLVNVDTVVIAGLRFRMRF